MPGKSCKQISGSNVFQSLGEFWSDVVGDQPEFTDHGVQKPSLGPKRVETEIVVLLVQGSISHCVDEFTLLPV